MKILLLLSLFFCKKLVLLQQKSDYMKAKTNISEPKVDIQTLLSYLKRMHKYFLCEQFPRLRQQLYDSLPENISGAILRYYDTYVDEVSHHMQYEEETLFNYLPRLMVSSEAATAAPQYEANSTLYQHHDDIELKFREFSAIFHKYFPAHLLTPALSRAIDDLAIVEEDLLIHCLVEDRIFMPEVHKLGNHQSLPANTVVPSEPLSEREQDVAVCVAKGLSNKEIAEQLYLSVNTVTTHRRNIAKKLNIHSSAGIAIYCIVNRLIDIDDINI